MDMKRIAVWSFLTMMVALLPAAAMSGEVAASAEEIRPLLIGSSVPDVQVQTIDGKQVSLPKALGDAPWSLCSTAPVGAHSVAGNWVVCATSKRHSRRWASP
jgi:hypothetical protein